LEAQTCRDDLVLPTPCVFILINSSQSRTSKHANLSLLPGPVGIHGDKSLRLFAECETSYQSLFFAHSLCNDEVDLASYFLSSTRLSALCLPTSSASSYPVFSEITSCRKHCKVLQLLCVACQRNRTVNLANLAMRLSQHLASQSLVTKNSNKHYANQRTMTKAPDVLLSVVKNN
jgi:hypothetical protein